MAFYNCYAGLENWPELELQDCLDCRSQEEADSYAKECAFNLFEGECGQEAARISNQCDERFKALYPDTDPNDYEEELCDYYYDAIVSHTKFRAIRID